MQIVLKNIKVNGNRIEYEYSYDEQTAKLFNKDVNFYIEYLDDINFENVPKSVLAVPFAVNLLPLCMVYDIELKIDELDKAAFERFADIRKGFETIYPDVNFAGKISADKLVDNSYVPSNETTCLFSGGVDATFTFLRHKDEHPVLFNVWGVDTDLIDSKGHLEMDGYFNKVSKDFGVKYVCIKSTLRTFLNESYLNDDGYKRIKDYWWHGAQHSIGLLSLLSPYNNIKKVKTNYIASTFTETELKQGVKCASYPVIDNSLKMASSTVVHDGFEAARIDKVRYICEQVKKDDLKLDLKVCFNYQDGKNCSNCEKCFRTIAAILVYDDDLSKYGFKLKSKKAKEMKLFLDTHEIGIFRWKPIQDAYIANPDNKNIKWLADYKFNNVTAFKNRVLRKVCAVLKKY